MVGWGVNATERWIVDRGDTAPTDLQERVLEWVRQVTPRPQESIPDVLAAAGALALARVTASKGERPAALDLLAADALVTFALEAQAQLHPEQLADFARRVLAGCGVRSA